MDKNMNEDKNVQTINPTKLYKQTTMNDLLIHYKLFCTGLSILHLQRRIKKKSFHIFKRFFSVLIFTVIVATY